MIACGVFAIIVGLMTAIFDKNEVIVSDMTGKIARVDEFLKDNKVGMGFRERVRMYLFYLAENKR